MATEDLTSLEAALRMLVSDLLGNGASFALVGGLAVSVRAEPRLTRDADVAVSVDDDEEAETSPPIKAEWSGISGERATIRP